VIFASIPEPRAAEFSPKEPVVVNGDKVEYFQDNKKVIGTGNISIVYKDVTLTCDQVTVYLDTKEAIAEGNVKIAQKEATFTGERINYNFDTKAAKAIDAAVSAAPFYGKAKEIDRPSEKEARLERGYVTTCDRQMPHYRIRARQVRIYFDDRIVARHITFYVGNVPVLYFPYYIQPLKEKSAHASILVGKESDWGYYALTSFRYYFSEICKGIFRVDYRTKKGLAEGVDNYYTTKSLGSGSAKFYYINENDATAYEKSGEVESKYRAQVRHRWDVTADTVMMLECNMLRDKNFIKDYFYKEYEELAEPDNYLSFITTKGDIATTFLARKRMDNYFTVVERLPEYRIDIKSHRMTERFPVYYDAQASGVYLNKTYAKSSPMQKDIGVGRIDAFNKLSYAARIFKALNVTPYAGTRQTYYSRNRWGDTNLVRGIFQAGLDNSIKFYKIHNFTSNFLGMEINKLRHIITPTANYYYTHQPTVAPDNLQQFDEIDAYDTDNGVRLALENKLQTKRKAGEDLASVDLATFIISSDYKFRLRDNNYEYKSQKFQSVDLHLELTPYPWLYMLSKMSINTKTQKVQTASVDLVATVGDKVSFGMGHRYEDVPTGVSNLLTADVTYKINDTWKVRAYERYNIDKATFEEQGYTVYRDLHCWLVEFTYDIKHDTEDQTFWIVFRLKAFPDVPLGLRRTYSRPQYGSVGSPS